MLIIKSESTATAPPKKSKGSFDYKTWYEANKERLSQKKAERYKTDKEYRDAALKRSRDARKGSQKPDLGEHSLTLKDVADQLGVSIWSIREWRRKNYFPEPKIVGARLYFSANQAALLGRLRDAFSEPANVRAEQVSNAVEFVFANWSV